MSRLARKVTKAKWVGADWASPDRLPADAMTVDMKTTGNTLSFWRDEGDAEGENSAVLAVLGTLKQLEAVDVAFVDGNALAGAEWAASLGDTVIGHLRVLHLDLSSIDHSMHVAVAQLIGAEVYANRTRRITRATFKSLMQSAVDSGKVLWSDVPESVRDHLTPPS